MRKGFVTSAFFLILVALSTGRTAAEHGADALILSGGDLPHSIRLTAVDEDAFRRRPAPPLKLKEVAAPVAPRYTVTTSYWDAVLRGARADRPVAAPDAFYYPSTGLVQATQGEAAVWLLLDDRQRAVLDRYVRLGVADLLPPEPSIFDVLRAAARDEPIAVEVSGRTLTADQAAAFWAASQGLARQGNGGVSSAPGPVWVVFTLPEGRAVQARYAADARALVDPVGAQAFTVPDALAAVLQAAGAGGIAAQIEGEDSPGSAVWWLLLGGGGAAALALAIWLARRTAAVTSRV